MTNRNYWIAAALSIAAAISAGAYYTLGEHKGDQVYHAGSTEDYERGPHRGRLLRDGKLGIELTIFEDGVPPEYRVYAYNDGSPIDPKSVDLSVVLKRLDGEINNFTFIPSADFLRGSGPVTEPHSFDVTVTATVSGKKSTWDFPSYEGRTTIDEEAAGASGIETEEAGQATIQEIVPLTGRITLNGNATTNVRARFAGIVKSVKKEQGDQVEIGEILATVESNDSLQVYSVTSPIKGTVISRSVNAGDVTGESPLFVVSDLSTVWAEFHVFPNEAVTVRVGQRVEISNARGTANGKGSITNLLPVADAATQTVVARVPLENLNGQWRSGMSVRGQAVVNEREVPLAVRSSALQAFRDFTVVFAKFGETYEVRMLELGIDDGEFVEVLEGIKPGTQYVSGNSFLIKADIEKSGASHDH